MVRKEREYIPALGYEALTPFFDPIQRWLVREGRFKRRLIGQAQLQAGQRVLDLGCGTGTLAIMVKRAQPGVEALGLDADPRMLKAARAKAAREGVAIRFDQGMAFALPYPDASFERVLSSLMIHHLKTPDKEKTAREVQRVLKPGGRLHVVDFGRPRSPYGRLLAPFLHGFEEVDDHVDGRLPGIFERAGLKVRECGNYLTFFGELTFFRGEKP